MKSIFPLLIALFISSFSEAQTIDLGVDGVLTYDGVVSENDTVILSYINNQTDVEVAIHSGGSISNYNYPVASVGQFRFTNHQHMMMGLGSFSDMIVNNTSIPVETVHHTHRKKMKFEMIGLLDLVKYIDVTHTTVQSGDWSDPLTWGGINNMPSTGDRILIRKHDTVTVASQLPNVYKTIRVDGMIQFATNVNTALEVETMVVTGHGGFKMGSYQNPIQEDVIARLTIRSLGGFDTTNVLSGDYDPFKLGKGLISHGYTSIHGAPKTGSTSFNGVSAGENSIKVDHLPLDWKVGDKIVIAGTQRDALGDEKRTIAGLDYLGGIITFDEALVKDHITPIHTKSGLTLKVHVINTTRNAIIETDESHRCEIIDNEFLGRGHIMFMHTNDVHVNYGGFYGLGRTNKQGDMQNAVTDTNGVVISSAQNPIARYPLHFHRAGLMGGTGVVNGCAVVNSPGWGYVNHSSNVNITNNVAYDISGAAFVSEAGNERGSFIGNVSIRTIGNGKENITAEGAIKGPKNILRFGSAGDGFWFHSQLIKVDNNVASGFTGSGFHIWNQFIDDILEIEDPNDLQNQMILNDNLSYGGYTGFNLSFMERAPGADYHIVNNFVSYGISRGYRRKYSHQMVFNEMVLIGDLDHPIGEATSSHDNGTEMMFINSHMEGFIYGIELEHRSALAGVSGGYLNNLYNLKINIRHERKQNVFYGGGVQFGVLSPAAMAALAGDTTVPNFDGNQYDYVGSRGFAAKLDDGFVDAEPAGAAAEISHFYIEENGMFYEAFVESLQHPDSIPWSDPGDTIIWYNKTNLELESTGFSGGIFSAQYYDTTLAVQPYHRAKNVVFVPASPQPAFLDLFVENTLEDVQIPVGTSMSIPLGPVFTDPHNQTTTYSVSNNSNATIADAIINNDSLVLTGLSLGLTTVTVEAVNSSGDHTIYDSLNVTVVNSNIAPEAEDDSLQVFWNTTDSLNVLVNDSDQDQSGYGVTIVSVSQGVNGTTAISSGQMISYTPNLGYSGVDSFTYVISDILGGMDTATVHVNVLPEAPDYQVSVGEGEVVYVSTPAAVSSSTNGNDGTTSFSGSTLEYVQTNLNHNGTDSCTYAINASSGLVSITIDEPLQDSTRELIFGDGFESGDFVAENWTILETSTVVVSGAANDGEFGARLKRGGAIEKTISTSGYSSIVVSYVRETEDLQPGTDYFDAIWSVDGMNWHDFETRLDGTQRWESVLAYLPAEASDQPNFTIRFDVHSGEHSRRAHLDVVKVTGVPIINGVINAPEVEAENHPTNDLWDLGDVSLCIDRIDTVQIKNEGTADLSLSSLSLNGPDFSIVSAALPPVLNPGANYALLVKLNAGLPIGTVVQDTLRFETNDSDEMTYVIPIQATVTEIINNQAVELCAGESLSVGSSVYSTSGVYTDILNSVNGCDSTVVTTLAVNPVVSNPQTVSICSGESYSVGAHTYTASGMYMDTLQTSLGCDSIITTTLSVNPVVSNPQAVSICNGESYFLGTHTYTVSGVYIDTLQTSLGCDSIITTTLTVNPIVSNPQAVSICSGESYSVGTHTYTASGMYMDTLQTSLGCDSIITTTLTVNPVVSNPQAVSICSGESYSVGIHTYTAPGTYMDTLQTVLGCDSVITTTLTVNQVIANDQDVNLCYGESYTIGVHTYSTSGVYMDTLQTILGCDSVITTTLTVGNQIDQGMTVFGITMTANEVGAAYQWIDCNNGNVPIQNEINQSFTPQSNGDYAVITTVGNCSDTSDCFAITHVGVSDLLGEIDYLIYPNPVDNHLFIAIPDALDIQKLVLRDTGGRIIYEVGSVEGSVEVDMSNYAPGIYFVEMQMKDEIDVQRIVKKQ